MNLTLLLDRTSLVDQQIINGHGWETQQIERLFAYIDAFRNFAGKRYFLDVGAYWGLYSLTAFQRHWFDHIIAFEPDPLNRSQLHAQLALNLLAHEIEVRDVAVSDTTHAVPFLLSLHHPTGNRAGTAIVDNATAETVWVRTDHLDNQLKLQDAVVFMKIDVEGAEVNVLTGATNLLAQNQVVLQVECFEGNWTRLRTLLARFGYHELGAIQDELYFTNVPALAPAVGHRG